MNVAFGDLRKFSCRLHSFAYYYLSILELPSHEINKKTKLSSNLAVRGKKNDKNRDLETMEQIHANFFKG